MQCIYTIGEGLGKWVERGGSACANEEFKQRLSKQTTDDGQRAGFDVSSAERAGQVIRYISLRCVFRHGSWRFLVIVTISLTKDDRRRTNLCYTQGH